MHFKSLFLISMYFLINCTDNVNTEGDIKIMDESIVKNLQILEKGKIFFGHQSVGFNIMDGISDLEKEVENVNINILESDGTGELPEYFFAHSRAGKNREPNAKCDDFSAFLKEDFANKVDIAFLKFCFVDMLAGDDPEVVFEYYKSIMDTIKAKYPKLILAHVTIPLTTIQKGWKSVIKKILNKPIGYKRNINRAKYNSLLKEYYKNDPIFDLSRIESTYSDGSREIFEYEGQTYYALVPEYSYDGAHLNELGRKIAAKELIKVLANALRQ